MIARARSILAYLTYGLMLAAALSSGGCAGVKSTFVWVDNLSEPYFTSRFTPANTIYAGDMVSVRVYNQESASGQARVGTDGKISIPLVGEVQAAGLSPGILARNIESKLKDFIVAPSVIVEILEVQPISISILGEVNRPGRVELPRHATLLDALAAASNLSDFATHDRIFVLRKNPVASKSAEDAILRIRFSYEKLTRAVGTGPLFGLQSGDVVVVE